MELNEIWAADVCDAYLETHTKQSST